MNPSITDIVLLKQIESGNQIAFSSFYNLYWDDLYAFVFMRTKDHNITREILQDLWIRIFERPNTIKTDKEGNARKYLFSILNYKIIDYYRQKPSDIAEITDENIADFQEISEEEYQDILEEQTTESLLKMIDEVLAELPKTQQNVYKLRILKNKSVDETATELGISNKTVRNQLSNALSEIRKKLIPKYGPSKKLLSLLALMDVISETNL